MKKLILPIVFCIYFAFGGNFLFGQSKKYIYQSTSNEPFSQYSEPIDELIADSVNTEEELFKKSFNKKDDWRSGRIVGGSDADIEDYPWHVALLNSMGNQVCAGSILSETWILTAAHCGIPSKIRAGVTNRTDITGQDRIVIQRIGHPLYAPYQNDVALLQLGSPLDFSDPKVQPIAIATQAHADEGFTDAGVMSVITGWGKTLEGGLTTDILQVAELPIVSNQDAVNFGGYLPGQITSDMLCAGYLGTGAIDACQGDSGGPLVVPDPENDLDYVLAGVTSWGSGCARPEYPGVWARVSHFQAWIQTQTGLSWNGPVMLSNIQGFSAEANACDQILLSWNNNAFNDNVMIALSDSGFFGTPVKGIAYNPGDLVPGGGTVLYSGNDTSYLHTGLEPGTVYFYKAWAVNNALEYSIGRFARDTTNCLSFSLPFTETFEDASESRNCWTQSPESGNHTWIFAAGSSGGFINTAKDGQKNARFTGSSDGPHVTKLVSPAIDLWGYDDVSLSFFYGQQAWSGDQNELKIYYRTAESEPWTQIGSSYAGNIDSWTQVQNIGLPNPSATYQIAFEGIDNWGHANVIDEVEITGMYVGPPEFLSIQDVIIDDNDFRCFAALQTITVAGNGSYFQVESESDVALSAGLSISILEGSWIKSGSHFHAYIDTTGGFCHNHASLLASNSYEELDIGFVMDKNEFELPDTAENTGGTIHVFPNPVRGEFTLRLSGIQYEESIIIDVYNIQGMHLLRTAPAIARQYTMDLTGFRSGVYLIRVMADNELMTGRIIKR